MIDHLLSYQVKHFVLFSKEVYLGVIESYNHGIWPIQIIMLLLSLIILPVSKISNKISSTILSGIWLWIGIVFHLKYFLEINWAAKYFSYLFFFEATLIFIFGVFRSHLIFNLKKNLRSVLGGIIFFFSAIIPINLLSLKDLSYTLLFGWGPDQTAVGMIGILFLMKKMNKFLWITLLTPPFLWMIISVLMNSALK